MKPQKFTREQLGILPPCGAFRTENGLAAIAKMLGFEIESASPIPQHELQELFEDAIGVEWIDDVQHKDGTWMPYPHYAFPRALPTELKGVAV